MSTFAVGSIGAKNRTVPPTNANSALPPHVRLPMTTTHRGERRDKRGPSIRELPREWEFTMLHVNRGPPDALRKSARIEARLTQGLADGLVARAAVPTR